MNIIVCIKQVPDVDDIKWTKENNLDRTQMLSKLNTADEWALDWAIKLKKRYKAVNVTVISMGPNQAKEVLEYALAKGADRAILLSDKAFSGSDTYATSKILANAIEKTIPEYHIILTGQKADDGDTEQVPVSLAEQLNIIDVTNVIDIHGADNNTVFVSQKVDDEINMYEVSVPCLIAIKKPSDEIYKPKINDYIRAQDTVIEVFNAQDLALEKVNVGIMGSPTVVNNAYRPQTNKQAQEICENHTKKIMNEIFEVSK